MFADGLQWGCLEVFPIFFLNPKIMFAKKAALKTS